MSHKATCQNCKVVRTFDSNRFVAASDLPPVLAVNANVHNEETLEHWLDTRKQIFLAPTVELYGQLYEDEEPTPVTYNLRASAFAFAIDYDVDSLPGHNRPSTQ